MIQNRNVWRTLKTLAASFLAAMFGFNSSGVLADQPGSLVKPTIADRIAKIREGLKAQELLSQKFTSENHTTPAKPDNLAPQKQHSSPRSSPTWDNWDNWDNWNKWDNWPNSGGGGSR